MADSTKTRKTVLFVSKVGHLGGSSQSLITVLRHLDRSLRPVLATPKGLPLANVVDAERLVHTRVSIPSLAVRTRPREPVLAATHVAWWAARHRAQLVAFHANGLTDAVLTAPAAVVLGLPLVVWVHDSDVGSRRTGRVAPVLRRLGRTLRWVAVSTATASELVRLRYASEGQVEVVPNPIDPATTLANRRDSTELLNVGFLGAPSVRKGFDLLPAVARGLNPERARLLVFARPYPDMPAQIEGVWRELRDLAPARVDLRGRCDDVRDALAHCDIVVCPSREESFCRVAAEAMLNGRPVVASALPAVQEVIGDDAGILVPPGEVEPMVAAVQRLADDTALRRNLGNAGRRRSAAFAPEVVTRRLEALYRAPRASGS